MTPKQRVLKKFPKAFAFQWAGPAWTIYNPTFFGNETLASSERTPQAAWAKALENIRRGSRC